MFLPLLVMSKIILLLSQKYRKSASLFNKNQIIRVNKQGEMHEERE